MQIYPYRHSPVKERKLRSLFKFMASTGKMPRATVCTTLNEHNGAEYGYVRYDYTSVVPTDEPKGTVWFGLRDLVEKVKGRSGKKVKKGLDHGGVFLLDPWGNVAVPVDVGNKNLDQVQWYANGKFGGLIWFDMPYGRHSHEGQGRYRLGEVWRGPADGLAFHLTPQGRILLSGDRRNDGFELEYVDSPDTRTLERDFARRFRKIGERLSRFYVNFRGEAFTAESQRYLGLCPIDLIFEDPAPNQVAVQQAIRRHCNFVDRAAVLELVYTSKDGDRGRLKVRDVDVRSDKALVATRTEDGARLSFPWERIHRFLVEPQRSHFDAH